MTSTGSADELAARLPVDQIAARLGEDPQAVRRAIDVALPALLGGLHANAQDPGGAASLESALDAHDGDLATPPVDVDEVDTADGAAISRHIFGSNEDQVVQQLGAVGGSSELVRKLLPILAPIVLSYLAKQVGAKGGAGGGALGSILSSIVAGAAQGSGSRSSGSADGALGSVLGDVLGGLLGAGRKS